MKNRFFFLFLGALVGLVLALFMPQLMNPDTGVESTEQPLYWVAPMDPNYRRDQPGQSPMGMDLIPVYASDMNANQSTAGEVSISPVVVNNLGVKTGLARMGTLQGTINTVGIIQYDENKLLHVHPRVEGWVEKLHVKSTGDQVFKGQLLYEIYSPELVNAQEEYLLALKRNNQDLIEAAQSRLQALQIPEDIIQSLRTQRRVRQTIPHHSPQNGVVEQLGIREGFFVKPGTTLMSIADLSSVWVEAQVLNHNKPDLIVGANATMALKAMPGQLWQGHVEYIYPAVDEQTRTIKARLEFNNETLVLKPNMLVDIEIEQPQIDALLIPKSALIRLEGQQRVVMQTAANTFKSVAVEVGGFDADRVQIKAGLLPGDVVVTAAQFLLDSESSKTSDFDRMGLSDMHNVAWAEGMVNAIDVDNRVVNISRGRIEKWNRPPATLDFSVPPQTNINRLEPGQRVQFYFQVDEGAFSILSVKSIIDGDYGS
ncbi:efflux RND transporter periplasmic adaptor subunit [Marinicella meishanensis]|uniref:efflux RND transporter periplasmic adaptor subunit n=1 Tax=Marinicella meishanensis TaxID=2873263 RepID=UPI001CBAE062|nr:efflux RND transporter periplasmic adaptor subunit [Marinicella sp. NBU2979]